MKNLIYTGGINHGFAQMAEALAGTLAAEGFESTVSVDLDDCARQLDAGGIALFTVYALRWRMLDGEKYAALRSEWAFEVTGDARAAIERHVMAGGGLMALHTAVICFDDWPQWPRMLGGGWVWGRSSHPPLQTAAVTIADRPHRLTAGLGDFALHDEVYQDLQLAGDIEVLASAAVGGGTVQHPAVWTHRHGAGRVFCDTLGHDPTSIHQPTHAALLRRGARWAATGH